MKCKEHTKTKYYQQWEVSTENFQNFVVFAKTFDAIVYFISRNAIIEFGLIHISETPTPDGFNLKGISGYIRNGAGMMNSAASLMKQFKGIIS